MQLKVIIGVLLNRKVVEWNQYVDIAMLIEFVSTDRAKYMHCFNIVCVAKLYQFI